MNILAGRAGLFVIPPPPVRYTFKCVVTCSDAGSDAAPPRPWHSPGSLCHSLSSKHRENLDGAIPQTDLPTCFTVQLILCTDTSVAEPKLFIFRLRLKLLSKISSPAPAPAIYLHLNCTLTTIVI